MSQQADKTNPNIRQLVNKETVMLQRTKHSSTNSYFGPMTKITRTVVDAKREAANYV